MTKKTTVKSNVGHKISHAMKHTITSGIRMDTCLTFPLDRFHGLNGKLLLTAAVTGEDSLGLPFPRGLGQLAESSAPQGYKHAYLKGAAFFRYLRS
jgi:hypothetical protein